MVVELTRAHAPAHRVLRPLPSELGYCIVIENFLSTAECRACVQRAESTGFRSASHDYPPSYRNNDRLVIDDTALAGRLYERLESIPASAIDIPQPIASDDWHMDGVNARMRFCRYTANQQFNIHQDGVHHRAPDRRSMLTFMIYLNDESEFSGGDTLFYADAPGAGPDPQRVVARVRPQVGTLILFDHGLWHAGAVVTAGTKYILRSDILFKRAEHAVNASSHVTEFAHQGYVWTLARLDGHHFASGGRDCSIRLWDDTGRPSGELPGHTQSVLGLAHIHDGLLASVSRDRTLRMWNLKTRQCSRAVAAHDAAVLTVAVIGDGRLVTGAADHKIKVWNFQGQALDSIEAHAGWVWKIVRLSDRLMASASEDGSVKVWTTDTFEMVACLQGRDALRTVAASPNGTALVTGDVTGQLRLWKNLHSEPTLEAEIPAHNAAIRCVHFIDDRTIASGGEDRSLKIWRDRPLRLCYEAHHDNFVTDFHAFDLGRGASCSYDGKISFHAWGVRT